MKGCIERLFTIILRLTSAPALQESKTGTLCACLNLINFFATAKRNGETVYIVGETKLRLDDTKKRDDVFKQLEKKISAVKKVYGDVQIVPLIVTHFAKESMLKKAKERGIIVVQSYEW
jgi:hypothetical protein